MMTPEINALLTRVEKGAPMGRMLKEYWVPACRSAKLQAEGAPERVRLFGENFVAYRNTDGRVGFLNEGCPHRCASLALARNEGDGLRCIFHGWKFDGIAGQCVDTPTEPAERRAEFAQKVPVKSYPAREGGGIVWVYLGRKAEAPPFPAYEFTQLPDDQVAPQRGVIRTNWLQGLEALLDSAHVTFLHSANLGSALGQKIFKDAQYMLSDGAPVFEFVEQPYGFREGALRRHDETTDYARVREVSLPFFSFIPGMPRGPQIVCCSIPIDDVTTAQWYIAYNPSGPLPKSLWDAFGKWSGDPDHFNADMGGPEDLWKQDRQAMKDGHWSGITGRSNAYEDFAVQESMGPIVDRNQEFLGSCDHVIIRARSLLLRAVKHFQETGEASFQDPSIDWGRIRAISFAYPHGDDWTSVDAFDPPAVAAE